MAPWLAIWNDPRVIVSLDDESWDRLLDFAQQSAVLGRLCAVLRSHALLDCVPSGVRNRLENAERHAAYNQAGIRFEVNRLRRALSGFDCPIVLLKGSAYLAAALPPAKGRLMSDVDILVPKNAVAEVEARLLEAGWRRAELVPYNERYYREWMHEIPPMWHSERRIVVDIHHTIIPVTNRFYRPNPDAMLEGAIGVSSVDSRIKVLRPADMVLHSAAHLFTEEFTSPFGNLLDLNDLFVYFGHDNGFWDDLISRSRLHALDRVLYYALEHSAGLLGTEIPEFIRKDVAEYAPPRPFRLIMNGAISRAIIPPANGVESMSQLLATKFLLARCHWQKMPPVLLAKHLAIKSFAIRQKRGRNKPTV